MINIKNIFKSPTIDEIVQAEKDQAQRSLLTAEASECYHRHMANYHRERIEKLQQRPSAA